MNDNIRGLSKATMKSSIDVFQCNILIAHDTKSSTCDGVVQAMETTGSVVDLQIASSVEDSLVKIRRSHFDIVFVCLDLPPAPRGALRLTEKMLGRHIPVVLITRSLRWIPPEAEHLRKLPWITPEAMVEEIGTAMAQAFTMKYADAESHVESLSESLPQIESAIRAG